MKPCNIWTISEHALFKNSALHSYQWPMVHTGDINWSQFTLPYLCITQDHQSLRHHKYYQQGLSPHRSIYNISYKLYNLRGLDRGIITRGVRGLVFSYLSEYNLL